MKNHVPATTRMLEPSSDKSGFCMSRSFFDQLPGHVPLNFHVPAGMPEIEPLNLCHGPLAPRSHTGKPSNGTWAPLIYKGAICPGGPLVGFCTE